MLEFLAHVVFKTPAEQLAPMKAFYKTFLNADIAFENDKMCFLRYDEEHHRVAIMAFPGTVPKPQNAAGLYHVAFTFGTLKDLLLSYQQRKAEGILPYCMLGSYVELYFVKFSGGWL